MMTLTVANPYRESMNYTESVYQHDKNVTMIFEGVDLPDEYEVIFSNQKDRGISVVCWATKDGGVVIPDALLSTGDYLYAWVRECYENGEQTTDFTVTIPVIPRPVPIHSTSTSSGDSPAGPAAVGVEDYSIDPEGENLIFNPFGASTRPTTQEEEP